MSLKGDMMFTKARRSLTVTFTLLLGLGLLGACAPAPTSAYDAVRLLNKSEAGIVCNSMTGGSVTSLPEYMEIQPERISTYTGGGKTTATIRLAGRTSTNTYLISKRIDSIEVDPLSDISWFNKNVVGTSPGIPIVQFVDCAKGSKGAANRILSVISLYGD